MRIALEITFSQGNSVARHLPRSITALSARVAGPTIPTPIHIYTATVVCIYHVYRYYVAGRLPRRYCIFHTPPPHPPYSYPEDPPRGREKGARALALFILAGLQRLKLAFTPHR